MERAGSPDKVVLTVGQQSMERIGEKEHSGTKRKTEQKHTGVPRSCRRHIEVFKDGKVKELQAQSKRGKQ